MYLKQVSLQNALVIDRSYLRDPSLDFTSDALPLLFHGLLDTACHLAGHLAILRASGLGRNGSL